MSDSESEVEYIEPDSTPLQTETMAQQLFCPPVVAQTRPIEGCSPALPRRLCRGRDVLTEDDAVDTRQVSAASDTVVSRKTHRKSECVPTVVPKLAAAPQAASEVVQPRLRGESLGIDTLDAWESGMEVAGGSPPAVIDISVGLDVLQIAVSVTAVVSEEWMERFVINLDVLCSDGLASAEDPAGGSADVASEICVVPDPLPTALSVWTVVAEKWMDRFVVDLLECPSVSRTSAVAQTFGPVVSEEYSPVIFAGGGGEVVDAYPLIVVDSDTAVTNLGRPASAGVRRDRRRLIRVSQRTT